MDSEFKISKETKSNLQSDLLHMFEQKKNVDIDLCVERSYVCLGAHKLILATRSPVLADMCFKEQHSILKMEGVSVRVLNLILWYIYSDVLKTDSPNELIEVAKAAQKYEISGVVRSCKHLLAHRPIDRQNVWSMLEASKYFKLEALINECFRLLKSLPADILFEMTEFSQINQGMLLYILQRRNILRKSDIFWMEGVIRWLQHRKSSSRSLLSEIHTLSLDCSEFLDLIEKYPSFFTSKEISRILCNMLRPGMTEVPSWCEMKLKTENKQPFSDYDNIITSALKLKLESDKKFLKSFFYEEDSFEGSIVFEIKLTKHFPLMPYLVMLELAFGSSYVPKENLELELHRYDQGALLIKKKVNFALKVTEDHYYLMVNHQMRLQKNHPFVFSLKLRASGLKKWGSGGPVSNRQYRVANIPENIFQNMVLKVGGLKCVCLNLLSDWLVFVDPKRGGKNPVLTTFYFDSIIKSEELGSQT